MGLTEAFHLRHGWCGRPKPLAEIFQSASSLDPGRPTPFGGNEFEHVRVLDCIPNVRDLRVIRLT
jgi:hypothetical protein